MALRSTSRQTKSIPTREMLNAKWVKKVLLKFLIKNIKQKSVFIFNKSSVQNVRILTNRVKTNGKVEFFILSVLTTNTAEVLIKTSSNLSPSGAYISPS